MSGIKAFGAYLPRLRLHRTTIAAANAWMNPPARKQLQGARAVCSWDEDAITMAVAAAQACRAQISSDVTQVLLASTTLPFADRSNAGLVAAALALNEEIATADVTGSQRCATSALIQALRTDCETLLIASEKRQAKPGSPQELVLGHGAVAMLIGRGANIDCLGTASLARDFVDHHRSNEAAFDYVLEERWVRDEAYFKLLPDAIGRALAAATVSAVEVTHLIIPASAAVGAKVAQSCGISSESLTANPAATVGDLGCAHALFGLALALETAKTGAIIVLIGFGQGVDALVLRVKTALNNTHIATAMAKGVTEQSYVRYLSNNGLLDMDFGMRSERDQRSAQTVAYRRRDAITAFTGGRCGRCNTVQFPRSRVCVNPDCRLTDTQVPHRLAEKGGRVKTFTEDWQAYSPRPPYSYGNVTFSEGGNLFMEFCDLEPGELRIDMPVRFLFRIKDIDRVRDFKRYFWKAAPAG